MEWVNSNRKPILISLFDFSRDCYPEKYFITICCGSVATKFTPKPKQCIEIAQVRDFLTFSKALAKRERCVEIG